MSSNEPVVAGVTVADRAAGNRRIALGLALFALLVFGSFIVRQWLGNP